MITRVAWAPYKPSSAHKTWYVRGSDHHGVMRRMKAFRSKRASEGLARNLTTLCERIAAGEILPESMVEWLNHTLDDQRRAKLILWGVIQRRHVLAGHSLTEHLDEWRQVMLSQGRDPHYVRTEIMRATWLMVDGCGWKTYGEIESLRLLTELDAQTINRNWSAKTRRHALTACKSFCNWMVKFDRAARNPLAVLALENVPRAKQRRPHRALTPDEQIALVEGVKGISRKRMKMRGPTRSLFYRLAMECGLRASAMHDLRVGDFALDGHSPVVAPIEAGGKRRAIVPLTSGTASLLRSHLAGRPVDALAFETCQAKYYAKALATDCDDVGIARCTFHSFRHTCATNLARAGEAITDARDIMGHASIETTAKAYTHVFPADLQRAVEAASVFKEGDVMEARA